MSASDEPNQTSDRLPSSAATPDSERGDFPRLVLVTGLSGSGKSSIAKCFEDLGYYTVDNLPLPLLERFVADPAAVVEGKDRIAVVADVRAPGFVARFPSVLDMAQRHPVPPSLLFLDASDEALVRRFSETRRPHPLAPEGPVISGIHRERELLADLRARADQVLDTSDWSIHEMRRHIYRDFSESPEDTPAMVVSLVSFGFKFGIPYGTNLLFDVRYLPNPYFDPALRPLTGLDDPVRAFLDGEPEFSELGQRLEDFLLFLLPRYRHENRSYLSVSVGCTGGKHRSVATVQRLAGKLEDEGWFVRVLHRDITR
ncbi:MAG: RNase adapter RapZ [Acidobacteriota bacterium]